MCCSSSGGTKLAFYVMQMALRCSAAGSRVFSREGGSRGHRAFAVTAEREFWRRYAAMGPTERHVYEIIRAGHPCHLYFGKRLQASSRGGLRVRRAHRSCVLHPCWHADVEYDLHRNPCVDGDAQVALLVHEVVQLFQVRTCSLRASRRQQLLLLFPAPTSCHAHARQQDRLGVRIDPSRHVVELDSTTPAKFSRHVVVRTRRPWAHAGHVHAFVALLLDRLADRAQAERAQQQQQQQEQPQQHFPAAPDVGGMAAQEGAQGQGPHEASAAAAAEKEAPLVLVARAQPPAVGGCAGGGACPVPGASYGAFVVRRKPRRAPGRQVGVPLAPVDGHRAAAAAAAEVGGGGGAADAAAQEQPGRGVEGGADEGLEGEAHQGEEEEEEGQLQLMVDTGVYTRNRCACAPCPAGRTQLLAIPDAPEDERQDECHRQCCRRRAFRVLLSSKFGNAQAVLRPTRRYRTAALLAEHQHSTARAQPTTPLGPPPPSYRASMQGGPQPQHLLPQSSKRARPHHGTLGALLLPSASASLSSSSSTPPDLLSLLAQATGTQPRPPPPAGQPTPRPAQLHHVARVEEAPAGCHAADPQHSTAAAGVNELTGRLASSPAPSVQPSQPTSPSLMQLLLPPAPPPPHQQEPQRRSRLLLSRGEEALVAEENFFFASLVLDMQQPLAAGGVLPVKPLRMFDERSEEAGRHSGEPAFAVPEGGWCRCVLKRAITVFAALHPSQAWSACLRRLAAEGGGLRTSDRRRRTPRRHQRPPRLGPGPALPRSGPGRCSPQASRRGWR